MLIPGVMGTKLVAEIDCEELKTHENETFRECGWTDCSKSRFEVWKKVPKKEYELWIPSITSPMSLFTLSSNASLCFAHLIKPHLDLDQDIKNMVVKRKGVKVKIFGFSERTKAQNNCGAGAIGNLLPSPIQISYSKAYQPMIQQLEKRGYVSGITLQAMPYNFYLSYEYNEFQNTFLDNLKRMVNLTGKKVTVVAHSMGNLNVLNQMKKLTQADKEKYIHSYVPIAPPYLGAENATKTLTTGDDEFTTLNGYLGFHFEGSVKTTSN